MLNTSWLAKPEQVERPRPVLGDERAGGGEVLAVHDLGRLGRRGTRRWRGAGAQAVEGVVEVGELLVRVARLAQLVAARVAQRRDAVAQRRVGVVAQPARRLHDVGVGVVDDEPRRVVPHRPILPPPSRLAPAHAISAGMGLVGAAAIVPSPVTAPAVAGRRGRVVEARACKALYPGSIPGVASHVVPLTRGFVLVGGRRGHRGGHRFPCDQSKRAARSGRRRLVVARHDVRVNPQRHGDVGVPRRCDSTLTHARRRARAVA